MLSRPRHIQSAQQFPANVTPLQMEALAGAVKRLEGRQLLDTSACGLPSMRIRSFGCSSERVFNVICGVAVTRAHVSTPTPEDY
jgi:hypothetical protein